MNNTAVRVVNLSKEYQIGRKKLGYRTLRDELSDTLLAPFRRAGKLLRGQATGAAELDEKIWALKDISLEIKKGETLGIIGRNGAGKSTLLKVLSRITEPTEGFADVCGRVSSLLEVGTGFHPELTGRENIFLNGAILGMHRAEINRKFDSIVEFAEIERFIDTPVKHFSSGMYLRLAFAVAAHLEPEILVVDEVLAVGDAEFQKKCLNKMENVATQGRTVIFVSHNMPAVATLCSRAILLDKGEVVEDGPAKEVVGRYLTSGTKSTAVRDWPDLESAPGSEVARLRSVRVCKRDGLVSEIIDFQEPFRLEMEFDVLKPGRVLFPEFNLVNEEGVALFGTVDGDPIWQGRTRPEGSYLCSIEIPGHLLADGMKYVNVVVWSRGPLRVHFWERSVIAFQVTDNFNASQSPAFIKLKGVMNPCLKWHTEFSALNAYSG
jgi:lipopolysaccharide transport system ATP-binding protein